MLLIKQDQPRKSEQHFRFMGNVALLAYWGVLDFNHVLKYLQFTKKVPLFEAGAEGKAD